MGLYLAVTANGGKSWHFRYFWLSQRKWMSLGTYPEVSLLEAHALQDEARALVARVFENGALRESRLSQDELIRCQGGI